MSGGGLRSFIYVVLNFKIVLFHFTDEILCGSNGPNKEIRTHHLHFCIRGIIFTLTLGQ